MQMSKSNKSVPGACACENPAIPTRAARISSYAAAAAAAAASGLTEGQME